MKILLIGYGKMGKELHELIHASSNNQVVGIVDPAPLNIQNVKCYPSLSSEACQEADVAIEFTRPEQAVSNIKICADHQLPIIVGTTGWYEKLQVIEAYVQDKKSSCIWAENFAIGVQLFFEIVSHASALLNNHESFDLAIHESHHNQKKDAPSGTAIQLAQEVLSNVNRKKKWEQSSSGDCSSDVLQVSSTRIGSEVGTHSLLIDSPNESITLTHQSKDRKALAKGALLAASMVKGLQGVYHFRQLLNNQVEVLV